MQFLVGWRKPTVSGEGVGPAVEERLLPQPEQVLPDAEPAGGLGDGALLLGRHAYGLDLKVGRVGLTRTSHPWTPDAESTPLTPSPRNLANLKEYLAHYHPRSNVESSFSMVKPTFGDSIRSRDE